MAHPRATLYSPTYSSNLSTVHLCVCVDFIDDLVSQYIFHLSAAASHKPSISPPSPFSFLLSPSYFYFHIIGFIFTLEHCTLISIFCKYSRFSTGLKSLAKYVGRIWQAPQLHTYAVHQNQWTSLDGMSQNKWQCNLFVVALPLSYHILLFWMIAIQ